MFYLLFQAFLFSGQIQAKDNLHELLKTNFLRKIWKKKKKKKTYLYPSAVFFTQHAWRHKLYYNNTMCVCLFY